MTTEEQDMTDRSTAITIRVERSPHEVFTAVTNVRDWWSRRVVGGTAVAGDEFSYEVPDVHSCRIRVEQVVPDRLVVWRVLDNSFSFVQDQQEWIGTQIRFEITRRDDDTTELMFTHVGLVPEFECYDVCHKSWRFYVGHSLRNLITTGIGQPNEAADDVEAVGRRMDVALDGHHLANNIPSMEHPA